MYTLDYVSKHLERDESKFATRNLSRLLKACLCHPPWVNLSNIHLDVSDSRKWSVSPYRRSVYRPPASGRACLVVGNSQGCPANCQIVPMTFMGPMAIGGGSSKPRYQGIVARCLGGCGGPRVCIHLRPWHCLGRRPCRRRSNKMKVAIKPTWAE